MKRTEESKDVSREKLDGILPKVHMRRKKPNAESHSQREDGKGKRCAQIPLFIFRDMVKEFR